MSAGTPDRKPKLLAACVTGGGGAVEVVRLADGRLVIRRGGWPCGSWGAGQLEQCPGAMLGVCGVTDASTELTVSVRRVPSHADN